MNLEFIESWCIYNVYNLYITYITTLDNTHFFDFSSTPPGKVPGQKISPQFPKPKSRGLHLFKKIWRKPWSVASMTLVNVFSNLMDAALSCHRPGAIVPPARRSFGVWKLRSMVHFQPFTGVENHGLWLTLRWLILTTKKRYGMMDDMAMKRNWDTLKPRVLCCFFFSWSS